jgi:hypothetical protein
MTDSPTRACPPAGTPGPGAAPDPTTPNQQEPPTPPLLRPEQRAPIGDGVKDLRPLRRAPYRALLDPAAYLDAPKDRRRTPKERSTTRTKGVDRPRSYRDDLLTKWRTLPLMWTEALRALVCLVPMMVATVLGQTTY